MRHGNKINHLGRKTAHRKALLMNMSNSLILHKRITTTVAKAKELRKHIEPLLNKTKLDTTHNRRILFSYLQDKESIKELFGVIADKIANRPGGYTRIIKLGFRKGDAADIAMIELVDFNEIYNTAPAESSEKKKSRRGGSSKPKQETTTLGEISALAGKAEDNDLVEDVVAEEVVAESPAADVVETAEEATEQPEAKAEKSEPNADDVKEESKD